MKVTATVDRLRREGVEVIDFGAGEPDFGTPDSISSAAHTAIDQHFTKYTPVSGTLELRRAICDRYRSDYGVDYTESEVITSAGGKQALFNTALALFSAGDEVVTHAPYWPTLTEQVKLAEGTPVLVRNSPEDGFAIRARRFWTPHGPDARHHHQLALQPYRRADLGGRAGHPRKGRTARDLAGPRSLLRS
jgi:aspartate aminotransferase